MDETIAMQSVSKFSGARGNPDERRIASKGKEEEHGQADSQVNGRIRSQIKTRRRPGNGSSYFNPLFAVAGHSFIHSLGDALMLPYRGSDRVKMRCYCVCADCRGIDCRRFGVTWQKRERGRSEDRRDSSSARPMRSAACNVWVRSPVHPLDRQTEGRNDGCAECKRV